MGQSRKEITKELSEKLEKYINPHKDTRIYYAKEVTFDYAVCMNTVRVDYMQFKPENTTSAGIEKGKFYAYEIKSCIEDFESGHGLNFIADYNYLVMEKSLYDELAENHNFKHRYPGIGVLIPEYDTLRCIVKPKERTRKYPLAEMLFCMFRSSNRDNIKRIIK